MGGNSYFRPLFYVLIMPMMFSTDWNDDAEAEEELPAIEAKLLFRPPCPRELISQPPAPPPHCDDLSSEVSPTFALGMSSALSLRHLAKLKPKHSAFTFDGRTVYSRTSAEVERATVDIFHKIEQSKHKADEISFGFDIEWRPIFKKGHTLRKTAVLQICMDPYDCYIMHIIHSGVPPILKSLLEDPSSSKVGIGIRGDAKKISRDYNVGVTPLVDLSKYANLKLGGVPKNWGLGSLTEMLARRKLMKPYKIRLGNWEANELSEEQIHYAATDAFASWHLYQVLKAIPDPQPKL